MIAVCVLVMGALTFIKQNPNLEDNYFYNLFFEYFTGGTFYELLFVPVGYYICLLYTSVFRDNFNELLADGKVNGISKEKAIKKMRDIAKSNGIMADNVVAYPFTIKNMTKSVSYTHLVFLVCLYLYFILRSQVILYYFA